MADDEESDETFFDASDEYLKGVEEMAEFVHYWVDTRDEHYKLSDMLGSILGDLSNERIVRFKKRMQIEVLDAPYKLMPSERQRIKESGGDPDKDEAALNELAKNSLL